MTRLHFHQLAIALLFLCLTVTALAQYAWVDENGVKQYSDMPPPSSVPDHRIIKRAGVTSSLPQADSSAAVAPDMSIAEKDAEFRKRRAEQAEKAQNAEGEAKLAAKKAENCERARNYENLLKSGQRIVRTEQNGQRSFLSDEQREREWQEVRKTLKTCQ